MKLTGENRDAWYYRNIDIKNRTIYFGPWQPNEQLLVVDEDCTWEVNDYTIQNIIKGLYILEEASKEPINIIWFSYGGDWDAGMALYDYINTLESPVIITCYGRVRSMGTIILQSADKRVLSPYCLFMIHYGTIAIETIHAKDGQAQMNLNNACNTVMEDIYLEAIKKAKPRYSRRQLQEFMKYDAYMSPREAIEMGLADETT